MNHAAEPQNSVQKNPSKPAVTITAKHEAAPAQVHELRTSEAAQLSGAAHTTDEIMPIGLNIEFKCDSIFCLIYFRD